MELEMTCFQEMHVVCINDTQLTDFSPDCDIIMGGEGRGSRGPLTSSTTVGHSPRLGPPGLQELSPGGEKGGCFH